MRRARKWILWIFGSFLAVLLLLAATLLMVIRSQWFYERVRSRIVETVETATGGRVEIGSFAFDWHTLRAEIRNFTLHGTEPADQPPLFHADSLAVGLKIISLAKRDVDIASLEVTAPDVFLTIAPDGATNIPQPKIVQKSTQPAMQTILDLAIGRFSLERGQFEVAGQGKSPFEARGSNLAVKFQYDRTGPRYRGDVSIQPLNLVAGSYHPLPVGIHTALTLEANRITVGSTRVTSGASFVTLSGAIENLAAPHGALQFDATVSVQQATPILRIPELRSGTMRLRGNASFSGDGDFFVASTLRGTDLVYRDPSVHFTDFRADGALTANPKGIDASDLHLVGNYVTDLGRAPMDCHIHAVAVRGKNLNIQGVTAAAFGGKFEGNAKVLNLVRCSATGNISGIEARPVVAMYVPDHLLWNALADGPVSVEGSFARSSELRATASLNVTPASDSAPVHGQVTATYTARDRTLDLGHSTVTLPSSRVDFAGILGRQMRVHLETRDLDDLLPAIGEKAANLPAKLTGTAIFEGTVTGAIDTPQIAGHTRVTGFTFEGENFDSLETDAEVSPANVRLRNAAVAQGPLRAQFQVAVGLDDWKTSDATPLSGSGTMRGGTVAGLEQLLELKDLPVSGGAAGSAQISGTLGDPHVSADFQLTRGDVYSEPFDRFTGHLNYAASFVEVTGGQINAGNGQAAVQAHYRHAPGQFDTGHLQLKVSTNPRPLDQVRTLQNQFPGIKGTAELTLDGEADLSPPQKGSSIPTIRITALNGDFTGRGLAFESQALGDAHLTATSQGNVVHAHLESNAANSEVRGDGEWRLEGDYSGTATVNFAKLDLAQLRIWLNPALASEPSPFVGSAEGQLRVDGPLLQPQALKAQLSIPKFEFGPSPENALPGGQLVLHNQGPIVASMANNVVTVESAHLVGAITDFSLGGRISLQQKSPLDLHASGKINLAFLHEVNSDFTSSGVITVDGTVRGPIDSPQANGRAEFQDASFNIEDVPNGISQAKGTLIFTGDAANGTRATIESFSGETGGGKIELTGFVGYNHAQTIFRLHARGTQVRIRYPEGVSTVVNANLNLTGTDDRNNLDGTLTIVRVSFNPQSDFSSLLGKSAQPVETPAARSGLLGGMNFDIQINTTSDVQFQSSLTQDVQMEANLRVRGTFSNPAVLGRINVTQGQLVFFGTKYQITQGSVQFFNPVRIDPILDIDLETKANGIDVTLNVSGPFTKPNLTPRSDPPLQFNEIVALLANGRSPTSDPTRLAQETTAPQSWQQMGASALLGQALASPVTGRLQRFFGVSQLRIDPTLPGVEYNPQARLTLEQQVTPDITFTYITDVTNSNPQVVRVEWSFSKQWSVVALREENGVFGMDFFFKTRF